MRNSCKALIVFIVALSGCTSSYRLSVEGGSTIDIFASRSHTSSYGMDGRDGMVSVTAMDVGQIEGLELGINAVRWSGPYTDNTLVGGNIGYSIIADKGYFVRASVGPYYGDETVRTATHWTFGVNGVLGLIFNGGRNEFYVGLWHFSNGSALGIGRKPNMSEEFVNCGVSYRF